MRIHNKVHKVSKKLITGDSGKKAFHPKITKCNYLIINDLKHETAKDIDVSMILVGHGKNPPRESLQDYLDTQPTTSFMEYLKTTIRPIHKHGSFLDRIDRFVQ